MGARKARGDHWILSPELARDFFRWVDKEGWGPAKITEETGLSKSQVTRLRYLITNPKHPDVMRKAREETIAKLQRIPGVRHPREYIADPHLALSDEEAEWLDFYQVLSAADPEAYENWRRHLKAECDRLGKIYRNIARAHAKDDLGEDLEHEENADE